MAKKYKPDFIRKQINDCVTIIDQDVRELPSFRLRWQSLATQLWKLLCDKRPLIWQAIPDARFHPMFTYIRPNSYSMFMATKIEVTGNRISLSCFNETAAPIPLREWLDQIIMVALGHDITVRNAIEYLRNREAAHLDPIEFAKHTALKEAWEIPVANNLTSYEATLLVIRDYVAGRTRTLLADSS